MGDLSLPPQVRKDALKKYLEAQRLEQAGNYPGAVAAYQLRLPSPPLKGPTMRVVIQPP